MKKRIARIVVYFGLTCLTALVLSHPYIRQSIFGPKIKGEPLWAWQQEFRYRFNFNHSKPTLWTKALSFLGSDSKPLSWVGYYPRNDPEMLPVLLSLANDRDEHVRTWVACVLGSMPPEERTISALIRMFDDPSLEVLENAIGSCGRLGPPAAAAVPKLRALLKHPTFGLEAAHSIIKIDGPCPELLAIVRDGMRSTNHITRIIAIQRLNEKTTGDVEIFAILVNTSRNDPDRHVRHESIYQLHRYGTKAVPHLISLLQEPSKAEQRYRAIRSLGRIGVDAEAAIPILETFIADSDEAIRVHSVWALGKIDPRRAVKK